MKTIAERRDEAQELRGRINRLQVVSQDTAYREGFNLAAMEKSISAEEADKVFLSADGAKGVLVLGISALGAEKAAAFIAGCGGWKSHANSVLTALDGERGEIRRNAAGTCWVIDLASPRRTTMFAWTSGPRETRLAGPRLNTTNGAAHWCGVVSATMPFASEKSPATVAIIQRGMECLAAHGMTPRQWAAGEATRRQAEEAAKAAKWEAEAPARAAAAHAAEEARIMAELEAEQAKLAAEKAAQEIAAKQAAAVAATCRAAGISPEQWQGMTPKQQGLALHRARLAGKI